MLVLTRLVGEEIIIAGNIRVIVVGVQGQKVRIAVDAPGSIPVDRREVHERRQGFQARSPGKHGADRGIAPSPALASGV